MSNEVELLRRITDLEKLIKRQPEVGGVWTAYTPTITSGTGAFTTVAATGSYSRIGKVILITMTITITTNGTAATSIIATLPFTVDKTTILVGRENAVIGKELQGIASEATNYVNIFSYDNLYPGGDGHVLYLSGILSVA